MSDLNEMLATIEEHEIDDHIGRHGWGVVAKKLLQWLRYFMARSRLWKRAAKKWRRYSLSSSEIFNMNAEEQMMVRETATRRLELLRLVDEHVQVCPVCLIRIKDHPFEIHKKASGHAEDCELARELRDD